jgi:hypothetical protein
MLEPREVIQTQLEIWGSENNTPFSSLFGVGWYMWVLKSKRYPAASKWLRPERKALGGVQ